MIKAITPSDIVIFGCTGDLANRKLYPALYQLFASGLFHGESLIVGVARGDQSEAEFTDQVITKLRKKLDDSNSHGPTLAAFKRRLRYVSADISEPASFANIKQALADSPSAATVFYFSTSPNLYGQICENLSSSGLISEQSKIVVEKPIGEDLESSQTINNQFAKCFSERQIYRIDHYLGKETVQNLISIRFANVLFESLWNAKHIDHVQITVAETVGVEGRVAFYDKAGALRDMVQNHLLQLLCLVAMEPPNNMEADIIRGEKLKVLRALKPIEGLNADINTVRGQYREGVIDGQTVASYEDEGCIPGSKTETFVALRAEIDNWRWARVPFYLRTGKRMPRRYSEIVIQFKDIPHSIFNEEQGRLAANRLVIRLQPEESIQLTIMNKVPGLDGEMRLQSVPLNLSYAETFNGPRTPEAYERLLFDVFCANQTLFMGREEVECAWRWIDKIRKGWERSTAKPTPYSAGSQGPSSAVALIVRDGRYWHNE